MGKIFLINCLSRWLLSNNLNLCVAFERIICLNFENDILLQVDEEEFHVFKKDQIVDFVKRALGYLFYKPVSAASFIISLLDYCRFEERESIFDLIFDTLIINYPDQISDFFKKIVGEKAKEVQINICLWILYTWSREIGNIESAYISSEFVLLHAWELTKTYFDKKDNNAKKIKETFFSILNLYRKISNNYLDDKIIPHASKRNIISNAMFPSNSVDVNLKLFDVLGRLAISGLWLYQTREIENESGLGKINSEVTNISIAVI